MNFFHAQLGLDICPKMMPSHIIIIIIWFDVTVAVTHLTKFNTNSKVRAISLKTAHSGSKPNSHHSQTLSKSSCPYPNLSLQPPTNGPSCLDNFYRPTPNYPHPYAPDAQTISIHSVLSKLWRFPAFIANVSDVLDIGRGECSVAQVMKLFI